MHTLWSETAGDDVCQTQAFHSGTLSITEERGYLHCGPNGAGHFVKMVHNGIEYGIIAAYAEGLSILRAANVGSQTHTLLGK
jgi:6-phosphogluconate dehydrogenase (decarboxylating)